MEEIEQNIRVACDERLFYLGEALRRGVTPETIHEWSEIDYFFLYKFKHIIDLEKEVAAAEPKDLEILREAKKYGFSDEIIAELWGMASEEIYALRKANGIVPVFKMVDTCAGEFESFTPYFYSTYEMEQESFPSDREKVIVLGSGPIRIGQGVEFDYATVHAVWAIQEAGYEAIVVNNNPETVCDGHLDLRQVVFRTADRRRRDGHHRPGTTAGAVVVQFGGQTAINLADKLVKHGVKILGTSLEDLDRAEDRKLFEQLLRDLDIPQAPGKTAVTVAEAGRSCRRNRLSGLGASVLRIGRPGDADRLQPSRP